MSLRPEPPPLLTLTLPVAPDLRFLLGGWGLGWGRGRACRSCLGIQKPAVLLWPMPVP